MSWSTHQSPKSRDEAGCQNNEAYFQWRLSGNIPAQKDSATNLKMNFHVMVSFFGFALCVQIGQNQAGKDYTSIWVCFNMWNEGTLKTSSAA